MKLDIETVYINNRLNFKIYDKEIRRKSCTSWAVIIELQNVEQTSVEIFFT